MHEKYAADHGDSIPRKPTWPTKKICVALFVVFIKFPIWSRLGMLLNENILYSFHYQPKLISVRIGNRFEYALHTYFVNVTEMLKHMPLSIRQYDGTTGGIKVSSQCCHKRRIS